MVSPATRLVESPESGFRTEGTSYCMFQQPIKLFYVSAVSSLQETVNCVKDLIFPVHILGGCCNVVATGERDGVERVWREKRGKTKCCLAGVQSWANIWKAGDTTDNSYKISLKS